MISPKTLFRLIALLLGVSPMIGAAALTQVMQEPFIGPGTLTATSPGSNFSSVSGTFTLVRVGPSTTASPAPGWSGDMRVSGPSASWGTVQLSDADSLCGLWGAWFRVKSLPPSGGYMSVLQLLDRGSNVVVNFLIDSNGVLSASPFNYNGQSPTFTGPTIIPNTWIWLAVAWQIQSGPDFPYGIRCLSRPLGGSLSTWGSADGLNALATSFSSVNVGLQTGGIGPMLRIGCPTLFSMSSFSDIAYPSGITPPVEQPYNWYVNPLKGNDGSTPATAWKTAAKLATESQYCGLLDSNAAGPGGGDVVTIDTSGVPLPIGTSTLTFATQGLKVQPAAGQTYIQFQAEEDLANASFTPTPGLSKTYQTTDTQANAVAWENNMWMWHVKSASFGAAATVTSVPTSVTTNYASTGAALDAVPGSFYTDGTNLYIHPFGDTNPSSDGNTYTRSINRGGGLAAVAFTSGNFRAIGFKIQKTALVDQNDNDFGAYCFQDGVLSGSGFSSSVEGGYFAYGDKHCFGSTSGVTNSTLLVLDTECEQGQPYCAYGGQTPFVSYSGATTADNVHIYSGCTCLARSGLIGSTAGDPVGTGGDIFLSHNNGSGVSFASITLDDCNFASGSATVNVATNFNVTDHTRIAQINTSCPTTTVQECTFPRQVVEMLSGAAQLTVQNSLIKPTFALGTTAPVYYGFVVSGTITIEGCTFDLSGITGDSTSYFQQGFIRRTGPLNLTFRNNAYLVPSGEDLPLLYNASSSDMLVFDHNAYNLGGGTTIARSFNNPKPSDLTFSQWQAVGQDCSNSSLNANLQLQSDVPQTGSPLLNAGVDLGSMADYTGTLYAHRDTIGAYQGNASFESPQTIAGFPPLQTYTLGASITLPATTASGLAVTYSVVSGNAQIAGNSLILPASGTVVISATQAGNSSNAPLSELETITVINAVMSAQDTPTLPTWGIWSLAILLALLAFRQRLQPARP